MNKEECSAVQMDIEHNNMHLQKASCIPILFQACDGKETKEFSDLGMERKRSQEVKEPEKSMHIFIEWSGHFLYVGGPFFIAVLEN